MPKMIIFVKCSYVLKQGFDNLFVGFQNAPSFLLIFVVVIFYFSLKILLKRRKRERERWALIKYGELHLN